MFACHACQQRPRQTLPLTCAAHAQPFLGEKTRSKVVLVYSEEEMRSALHCIPPERLYPVFGGTKEVHA